MKKIEKKQAKAFFEDEIKKQNQKKKLSSSSYSFGSSQAVLNFSTAIKKTAAATPTTTATLTTIKTEPAATPTTTTTFTTVKTEPAPTAPPHEYA
jgi:hypothetical protein